MPLETLGSERYGKVKTLVSGQDICGFHEDRVVNALRRSEARSFTVARRGPGLGEDSHDADGTLERL